jgi:hypothetical protein
MQNGVQTFKWEFSRWTTTFFIFGHIIKLLFEVSVKRLSLGKYKEQPQLKLLKKCLSDTQ